MTVDSTTRIATASDAEGPELLEVVATEQVGNTQVNDDGSTTRYVQHHVRSLHLRLPTRLVPMPGSRLDLLELEDWIVGAFCVTYQRVHGAPPPLSHAAIVSGRSERRVRASWERMAARGWLGMAKVPHRYGDRPGEFGYKWRIWIPHESPLRELLDQRAGSGFKFVAVPQDIARYRSVLATALYLVIHEQRRIDGAATTTCTDLANLLSCDRNTVRRLLERIGAIAVESPRPGTALYDMPIVFEGKLSGSVTLGDVDVPVHGNLERRVARMRQLAGALNAAGVDSDAVFAGVARELVDRLGYVRLDLVVRVIEERYRRELAHNPAYRVRLALRLGRRLRGAIRGHVPRELVELPATSDGPELDELIRSAVAEQCTACEGTRLQLERIDGYEYGVPCRACCSP